MTNPRSPEERPPVRLGVVADAMGVDRRTVWTWAKTDKIRTILTPGGQYRVPQDELERLLQTSGPPPALAATP